MDYKNKQTNKTITNKQTKPSGATGMPGGVRDRLTD